MLSFPRMCGALFWSGVRRVASGVVCLLRLERFIIVCRRRCVRRQLGRLEEIGGIEHGGKRVSAPKHLMPDYQRLTFEQLAGPGRTPQGKPDFKEWEQLGGPHRR